MRGHPEMQEYYRVEPHQRLIVGVLYFGLAILARARDARDTRAAQPSDGRQTDPLRRGEDRGSRAGHRPDRTGVPRGLPGRRPDRSSRGDHLRLCACPGGHCRVPRCAGRGTALRRARVGRRHRRRARSDGGRKPRRQGWRWPVGRLQHRAAARAGARTRISTSRSPSSTSTHARRCS